MTEFRRAVGAAIMEDSDVDEGASRLFTFVLDYRGGTYIRQHVARNVDSAVREYLRLLRDGSPVPDLKEALELSSDFAVDSPTPVDGLRHVWCMSTLFDDELALLNIIGSE